MKNIIKTLALVTTGLVVGVVLRRANETRKQVNLELDGRKVARSIYSSIHDIP